MKKTVIEIPDDLTPIQEVAAIAKQMSQKALESYSPVFRNRLRIGSDITVKDLTTEFVIKRVSADPIIEMVKCSVCGTDYQSNAAKFYFTNYGGNNRKKPVCSDNCVELMAVAFPGRCAAKKSSLKPLRFF